MSINLNFTFRKANLNDIPFLVDTIIEAEKSGTSILSYSTIFGLTETECRRYLKEMLLEEVNGCELSVSSFKLAELNGTTVAAIASWVEGSEGIPSQVLKGNLLSCILPKECMARAAKLSCNIKDLHIDYIPGTLQIGLVFVKECARGKNLAGLLIEKVIHECKLNSPLIKEAYVQVFGNNQPAIRSYEKAGFTILFTRRSTDPDVLNYMPHDSKVVMIKEIY